MNLIKTYLEQLQDEETSSASGMGFAIDSFPSKKNKKKKVIRVIYPNENWMALEEKRAMIDLDGTIHKYSNGYQDGSIYDGPFQGAKQVINWLKSKGYEIVIFTTRASKGNALEMGDDHEKQIQNVENWLKDHEIYFDRVTADKLAADFYIDDKAITIKDGNWKEVYNSIKKRMKYSH